MKQNNNLEASVFNDRRLYLGARVPKPWMYNFKGSHTQLETQNADFQGGVTMLKRFLSLLLMVATLCTILMTTVLATDGFGNIFGDGTATPMPQAQSRNIITRNRDGTTICNTFISQETNTIAAGQQDRVLPGYFPELVQNTRVSTSSQSPDEYGRTLVFPADSAIGYVTSWFDSDGDGRKDRDFRGTASLQNHDILISCAHLVWKPQYANNPNDGWTEKLTFYAGKNHNDPCNSAQYVNISIDQAYVNNVKTSLDENQQTKYVTDDNFDWSIIRLNRNLGSICGWLGLHGCGAPELNWTLYAIGYPSDKSPIQQWKSTGQIIAFDDFKMYYNGYLYFGNSGGPFLDDYGSVYGITTFATVSAQGSWICSGGVRMDPLLFDLIAQERQASEERWKNT